MGKKSSFKGKKQYPTYKAENRVFKNKVKKLERHIKAYPNDEKAKRDLERIMKEGYTTRQRPHNVGSNPPKLEPKLIHIRNRQQIETFQAQLAELLGIPVPQPSKKRKTKVKVKRKKDVSQHS